MGKKEQFERPERGRRRTEYRQGDLVVARYMSLWSVGTFVEYNQDGTLRIRLGKDRVNLRHFEVEPTKKSA